MPRSFFDFVLLLFPLQPQIAKWCNVTARPWGFDGEWGLGGFVDYARVGEAGEGLTVGL